MHCFSGFPCRLHINMIMDLRLLRTFVTIAEQGTVSNAATRLRITQPALSRRMQDLQRELGLRLFDRVGRRLVLTSAGEQLLGECRSLLGLRRRTRRACADVAGWRYWCSQSRHVTCANRSRDIDVPASLHRTLSRGAVKVGRSRRARYPGDAGTRRGQPWRCVARGSRRRSTNSAAIRYPLSSFWPLAARPSR